MIPQIAFQGKGEFGQVAEFLEIIGFDPGSSKSLPIKRHILIYPFERILHPPQL